MFLDDLHHSIGIRRLFEGLTKFFVVKELGDVGEGVEMFLKLTLRNEKEHDEVDRLIIERIEVHTGSGSPKGADHFINKVSRSVWNSNTETDSGAHRRFALFNDGSDGFPMFGLDFSSGDEDIDQLVNGFPAIGRLQIGDNLLAV